MVAALFKSLFVIAARALDAFQIFLVRQRVFRKTISSVGRVERDATEKRQQRGCYQRTQSCRGAEFFDDLQASFSSPLLFDRLAALQQFEVGAHFNSGLVALARIGRAGAVKDGVEFEQALAVGAGGKVGGWFGPGGAVEARAQFV